MLMFTNGDIFAANTEAIVNTVNCVGAMGRGLALQFKGRYPGNFAAYEAACKRGEVVPGKMFVFMAGTLASPKYIINFPTKRHWRDSSRMEDIQTGLADLVSVIRANAIKSIAIPPLGAGLGGLAWQDVRHAIENELGNANDVDIVVLEPSRTAAR